MGLLWSRWMDNSGPQYRSFNCYRWYKFFAISMQVSWRFAIAALLLRAIALHKNQRIVTRVLTVLGFAIVLMDIVSILHAFNVFLLKPCSLVLEAILPHLSSHLKESVVVRPAMLSNTQKPSPCETFHEKANSWSLHSSSNSCEFDLRPYITKLQLISNELCSSVFLGYT